MMTGFCSSCISLGYYQWKPKREIPPLEDDKKTRKPARALSSFSFFSLLQTAVYWLAAQRPSGTVREPTSTCDERRWPIVSCYWKSTCGEEAKSCGWGDSSKMESRWIRVLLWKCPLARWMPIVTHSSSAKRKR